MFQNYNKVLHINWFGVNGIQCWFPPPT